MGRHDRHQAEQPLSLACGQVDYRKEQRVGAGAVAVEPVIEAFAVLERAVGQIVPELRVGVGALQHVPQVLVMTPGVELFQADITPGQGGCGGQFRRLPL
ncbi:hypothetical protein D3C85_1615370 [compost metagenome]